MQYLFINSYKHMIRIICFDDTHSRYLYTIPFYLEIIFWLKKRKKSNVNKSKRVTEKCSIMIIF